LNRRTAQIDGNGNRITFGYDKAGHLVQQKNSPGETQTWTYDEKGRLKSHGNGVQSITYSYDASGRPAGIDFGNGQKMTDEYDAKGRVKKISTATTSVRYFYDSAGHTAAKQFTRGNVDRVIRYTYDGAGRKASVVLSERTDPKADYHLLQQTAYRYDALGRLAEIEGNGQMVCTYVYDSSGRLSTRQYGNGIQGAYQYDAFGRQTRLELGGGPLSDSLVLGYKWDNAGQLLARFWNHETQIYKYDPAGQLLTVSAIEVDPAQPVSNPRLDIQNPVLAESYKYDAAGNMVQKLEGGRATTMAYNSANELVSSASGGSTAIYAYDKAGRLSEESTPQWKTVHTYGYLDKVLALTKPDGTQCAFDYWPDGQLATGYDLSSPKLPKSEIILPKSTDDYLWDDLALIYHNGETYAVEPHVNGGSRIARFKDGQVSYDINDMLGTTLAVVSDTELKITPLTAFGRPKSVAPDPGAPAQLEAPVAPSVNPNPAQNIKTK